MEREQSEAGERYTAVQEFRSYLADLLDCLQHKSVIVEELEDRVYELLDDRAQADREEAQVGDSGRGVGMWGGDTGAVWHGVTSKDRRCGWCTSARGSGPVWAQPQLRCGHRNVDWWRQMCSALVWQPHHTCTGRFMHCMLPLLPLCLMC